MQMGLKVCSHCGEEKDRSAFPLKDAKKIKGRCRVCDNKRIDQYRRLRVQSDPTYRLKYRAKKIRQRTRRWELRPSTKTVDLLRAEFNRLFRDRFASQKLKAKFGYTAEDLMTHLERQFTKHVTWGNYGTYWHIDHILPVSSFSLTNEDGTPNWGEVRRCWALSNLRPLLSKVNISKGAKRLHLV